MSKSYEKLPLTALVHGKMIYSCEQCGEIWSMYLEKGIEEFGENHKPSPFMIVCPYCGGWAMDVSGIQKLPGEAYMVITNGAGYFADMEGKDCGVPIFPSQKTNEADDFLQNEEAKRLIEESGERIRIEFGREIEEAVRMLEEEMDKAKGALGIIMQKVMESLLRSGMDADAYFHHGHDESGKVINYRTVWDRKEERERLRTVERETASRFRQRKARECAWGAKKRTGNRGREWRGSWRESKSN